MCIVIVIAVMMMCCGVMDVMVVCCEGRDGDVLCWRCIVMVMYCDGNVL